MLQPKSLQGSVRTSHITAPGHLSWLTLTWQGVVYLNQHFLIICRLFLIMLRFPFYCGLQLSCAIVPKYKMDQGSKSNSWWDKGRTESRAQSILRIIGTWTTSQYNIILMHHKQDLSENTDGESISTVTSKSANSLIPNRLPKKKKKNA